MANHLSNKPGQTRDQVRDLYKKGLKVRDISRVLGISTQRVYQHLKSLDLKPPTRQDTNERGAA